MTAKQLNDYTAGWLMALKTSQAAGDSKNARTIIDELARAHGIPANYQAR
jgi:hypothetical protein